MKAFVMLRVVSAITLLYFAGHMLGIPWTPAVGPQESAFLEPMKSERFYVEGFSRTYWDFYFGFGCAIGGFLLLQAVVLWQVASLAKRAQHDVRPIVAAFFASFLVNAILVWRYFFTAPLVLAITIAICLGITLAVSRSEPSS